MRQFIIINSAGYFMRLVHARDPASALAEFAADARLPIAGLVCRPASLRLVREFHRQRSVSGIGSDSCLAPWAVRVGGGS